jgi:hypothetical protein
MGEAETVARAAAKRVAVASLNAENIAVSTRRDEAEESWNLGRSWSFSVPSEDLLYSFEPPSLVPPFHEDHRVLGIDGMQQAFDPNNLALLLGIPA